MNFCNHVLIDSPFRPCTKEGSSNIVINFVSVLPVVLVFVLGISDFRRLFPALLNVSKKLGRIA